MGYHVEAMAATEWDDERRRSVLVDLFDAHSGRVNGFVYARCGDSAVAADVTADVFLAAARAVGGDDPAQVTLPWLLATARRRLIDQWRLQRTQRRTMLSLVSQPAPTEPAPSDVDRQRVQRALDALSDSQRSALMLRYLDEMSVSEVADALELSYRATESLLARARRSFERAWEEA